MPVNAEQNQKQEDNNQNQQTANPVTGGGVSQGAPQGRTASFSTGAAPTQTGSGRYTNLQKYLGANQGAGDRLAQGIGSKINQSLKPGQTTADTEASKVAEGIQRGQNDLQRGQGYNAQLQDQNFNAQDFANNQNQLQDFTNFRTGQAIDTNAINNQLNTAQTANQSQQLAVQNRIGQVGNEAGRFGLLKEAFGGMNKPYSTGQQRLDQLFLQAGGGNNIGQLQNNLNSNLNNLNQGYAGLQGRTADINALTSGQTSLANQLQDRTNQMETGYIDNLQGQVAGINAARDAEKKRYNDFVNQLIQTGQGKETSQALDEQLFNEALLRNGEQSFNFFKNPTLTSGQFLNENRNANDYKDIATQGNVDYYDALSKLAGINNSKLNTVGSLIDQNTGQLNRAAQFKEGEGSLRSGITQAQDDFIKYALGANIVGTGEDSGTSGLFGRGGTARSQMGINLADYLKQSGLMPTSSNNPTPVDQNYAQMIGSAASPTGMALSSLFGDSPLGQAAGLPGAFTGSVASSLGLTGNSGSSVAAQARARQNLLDNLTNTLQSQGYNNYITKSGIKNADDLANQARNIETNRLSDRNDNQYYTNALNTPEQQEAFKRDEYLKQLVSGNGGRDISLLQNELQNARSGGDAFVKQLENQYADSVLANRITDVAKGTRSYKDQYGQDAYYIQLTEEQKAAERAKLLDPMKASQQGKLDAVLNNRQATETKYNDQQAANRQALMERLGISDVNLGSFDGQNELPPWAQGK